jgi:hypothetical protein
MVRQSSGERGKVSGPAKRVPYGTTRSYNREVGSRTEGPRLAAEDGVSDDARRNEPWPSQGPLGTSGSAAEEMAGTQRPGIISPHGLSEGGGQPSMNVARATGTLFLLGIAWEYHR